MHKQSPKFFSLTLIAIVLFGLSAMGAGLNSDCWTDYPKVGPTAEQPIPGFPTAASFKSRKCVANEAACSGGIPRAGMSCDTGLVCCLIPATNWTCYNNYVGADRANIKETNCFAAASDCKSPNKILGTGYGCPDPQKQICCAVMSSATSTATSGAGAVPKTGSTAAWSLGGQSGGLRLVACTETGDCEIQDIVQQGIYFADFLIGLSGALFLIAFIWGGAMYLLSFGRSDWVRKGHDAMVKSAIGIVFIMLAWTIVTYVAASLGYTRF